MTLGSLFSGSGGFELAGLLNGIEPRWNAEIEPFPCAVTAKRFPGIPNHGDVTKIDGSEIEPVDIITFGSPCQDLSVAGLRKGIHEGQRSNLFFEAIRIIKEMREATNGKYPRFAVWENVPGAFSSNGGSDFRAVLEALCQIKDPSISVPGPDGNPWKHAGCIVGTGYSIAWRVYDAQFWGVPQRRARIYLIADFGSERAGEILFESESMPGNPAESGEPREAVTADSEGSTGRGNSAVYDARGNGGGLISPNLTGDHQNRVTDYTAVVVERERESGTQETDRATRDSSEIRRTRSTACMTSRLFSNYSGTGIAETLDASYYKGPGARNGKEREFICLPR